MIRPAGRWSLLVVVLILSAAGCDPAGDDPTIATSPTPTSAHTTSAPTTPGGTPAAPTPTPTPAGAGLTATPDPTALPTDPARLSEILVRAERLIRRPDLAVERLSRWADVQQAAYRLLSRRPALREPVRRAVPPDLRRPFDLNLRATVELRKLTEPRSQLPEWRIVAPPAPEILLDAYRDAAGQFGLDWTYLAAIHLVETRMGRIQGTSTAGAQGPMQFLPSTWEAYGEGDIDDPHDAIRAAARYLAAHGAPEDMAGALYAYNHSERYVQAISDHAAVMRAEPVTYRAYHQWRVYYRMVSGERILEEGWSAR